MAAKVQVSLKGLICSERLDIALFGASEPRKALVICSRNDGLFGLVTRGSRRSFLEQPGSINWITKRQYYFHPCLTLWLTHLSKLLFGNFPTFPTLNAFETVIPPSSVYSKLFNWLIPLNLGALVVCFLVFNSITDARQPFIPRSQ